VPRLSDALVGPDDQWRDRVDEYWSWVAVALYLLTTVDMLTTVFAAAEVGVAYESNPLVQWLLRRSLTALVGVNLAVVVAVVVGFRGVIETIERTPPAVRPYYVLVVEAWLGLLVAVGLFVFANNLAVVVLGESLL
jgi:hypothetical protein